MEVSTTEEEEFVSYLREIKNYILDMMKPLLSKPDPVDNGSRNAENIYEKDFADRLKNFLQRLIDPREFDIEKTQINLKAGRQLLCNIGIDIKYGNVPPEHYLLIFKAIDFSVQALEARLLFSHTIQDEKLYYRQSFEEETEDFGVLVFRLEDICYYCPLKLSGENQQQSTIESIIQQIEGGKKLYLGFNRIQKPDSDSLFWMLPKSEFQLLLSRAEKSSLLTNHIIDQLGLSHHKFVPGYRQYYFYLDLGKIKIPSFKPNATLADWDNPRAGFVSCFKQLPMGHTFSITGYQNFAGGVGERVFLSLELDETQKKEASIELLKASVVPPLDIDTKAIVVEGISRFHSKQELVSIKF